MAAMREHGIGCAPVNAAVEALRNRRVQAPPCVSFHAGRPLFGTRNATMVALSVQVNGWKRLKERLQGR